MLSDRVKDFITWCLVAFWLLAGAFYVAACSDQEPDTRPARDPFPLQSAWQNAPRPEAPEVVLP